MRRNTFGAIIGLVLRPSLTVGLLTLAILFGGAASSSAQVKRVQMHIAGYLCGN
ncbi:MAG: hypothetical protein QOE96_1784 [Blastocatellia bacterium]|jgi:hypothetical protein|nr:hypothetical protein [Blastocatellia bacterium]